MLELLIMISGALANGHSKDIVASIQRNSRAANEDMTHRGSFAACCLRELRAVALLMLYDASGGGREKMKKKE